MSKRLTKIKNHYGDYTINEEAFSLGEDEYQCCVNALGWYEDIANLCEKITKLPIYKKRCDNIIYKADYRGLSTAYNFLTNCIEVYDQYGFEGLEASLPVNKYGIEWAITKEELL